MADYYDTVIVPTRVRKPKDKAAVEGSVKDVTNFIFGRIRNRTFYSFDELNKYIGIVRDMEKAGKKYKKKSHYQAIIDMVNHDRKVGK